MKILENILLKLIYSLIIVYLIVFVPILWKYYPLIIVSGSMEPKLKVGGILYYHKIDSNNYDVNDILVYKTKKHIISHRIISKDKDSFMTKGDANKNIDKSIVKKEQILGKGTEFSIPYIGYYIDFIFHHKYWLLFISVVLLIDTYCKERNTKNE